MAVAAGTKVFITVRKKRKKKKAFRPALFKTYKSLINNTGLIQENRPERSP